MATDLEGNFTVSKELQVDLCVLKRSPALTRYKAREDLFRCAACCSHILARCFSEFLLFLWQDIFPVQLSTNQCLSLNQGKESKEVKEESAEERLRRRAYERGCQRLKKRIEGL